MEKLQILIDEYNIRFNNTEIIRKEGYPFASECELDRDDCAVKITPTEIWNQYGCVYKQGVWATADIKKLPERWFVELDEFDSLFSRFAEWYKDNAKKRPDMDDSTFKKYRYWSALYYENDFFEFENYQFLTLEQWAEFCLPKIDFSIIEKNKGKWFYIRGRSSWILKDVYVDENKIKKYDYAISYSINSDEVFENYGTWGYIDDVIELRLATDEDLKPFFEKYPEYAPSAEEKVSESQPGDYGLVYDDIKLELKFIMGGVIYIRQLSSIDFANNEPYDCNFIARWKYFYPIDINLPLQPQLDEFVRQNQKT